MGVFLQGPGRPAAEWRARVLLGLPTAPAPGQRPGVELRRSREHVHRPESLDGASIGWPSRSSWRRRRNLGLGTKAASQPCFAATLVPLVAPASSVQRGWMRFAGMLPLASMSQSRWSRIPGLDIPSPSVQYATTAASADCFPRPISLRLLASPPPCCDSRHLSFHARAGMDVFVLSSHYNIFKPASTCPRPPSASSP